MALQELGADVAGMALCHATITVWDADPRLADEKLRLVEKVIQAATTAMIGTVNAVDAWLPAVCPHASMQRTPAADLDAQSRPHDPLPCGWGPERDEHFDAPLLLYGRTEGLTPFRLFCTWVTSATRSSSARQARKPGCSRLALQFRRYLRSQVFAFDFGRLIRAALAKGRRLARSRRRPTSDRRLGIVCAVGPQFTIPMSVPGPLTGSSRPSCGSESNHPEVLC